MGYLPQEPELEAGKTVHELVMEGMSETKMIWIDLMKLVPSLLKK